RIVGDTLGAPRDQRPAAHQEEASRFGGPGLLLVQFGEARFGQRRGDGGADVERRRRQVDEITETPSIGTRGRHDCIFASRTVGVLTERVAPLSPRRAQWPSATQNRLPWGSASVTQRKSSPMF